MNWIGSNLDLLGELTLAHVLQCLPPIIFAFILSLPVGWLATRYRASRGVILTLGGLLYAIPSFPLFVVLPLIIGVGIRSAANLIIALTIYGVALMVRVVADGLDSVDADVRQSAAAVGFSAWSAFWRVELPLAGPVLLAGLRVVAVSTVSLATVGAVIGVQNLGSLFTDGFQRSIQAEIIAGIVLTVAVALIFDGLLVLTGRLLMPWTRSGRAKAVPDEASSELLAVIR